MKSATGRAPAKMILIGEHAAVYGHPSIAAPVHGISSEVTVEFRREDGVVIEDGCLASLFPDVKARKAAVDAATAVVAQALSVFGEDSQGVAVRIRSSIPVARGMGSSAAFCVAAIRAICKLLDRRLGVAEVAELAYEAEKLFHSTPSGIDNNVVAHGRPIYFVKRKGAQAIKVGPTGFRFLIADTGIGSRTSAMVEEVRLRREEDRARYDSLFWEIGSMASVAREVIRVGSRMELGMCLNRNHELLCELGVTCGEIEHLVEAARDAGAAGAKLSGAGKGGCVIAVVGDDTDELKLAAALKQAGATDVFETELAANT